MPVKESRESPRRRGGDRPAPSLTDRAYADIEEMIVFLKLAPGQRDLGGGAFRPPRHRPHADREALQRLARERLVTILPRRGIIVSPIDVAAQLRLLEVRRELERLIARSAARRATEAERTRFRLLAAGFEKAAKAGDDVAFMRIDRDFNILCSAASHNEFAANA
jgi:DNA-binding GntR family transcriptional regulator